MDLVTAIFFILGAAMLAYGADQFVLAAQQLALRLRIPAVIISLTLIAFGTSLPEMITSVRAGLEGSVGIAVGNVLGSNIANILLIAGLTAFISPLVIAHKSNKAKKAKLISRDGLVLALSTGILFIFFLVGRLMLWQGLLCLLLLAGYMFVLAKDSMGDDQDHDSDDELNMPLLKILFLLLFGLALLLFGSQLLIENARTIALQLGVSEVVIGVTLVALGTSLPELSTGIAAVFRKQYDIVLGNVIGSNIFNILSVFGVVALIAPSTMPTAWYSADVLIMLGTTLVFLLSLWVFHRIGRWLGLAFLLGYALFIFYSYQGAL